MPKKKENTIEIIKGKPRKEEEKFFVRFSETQLTAVLLIILAATFLIQGIERYLTATGKAEFLKLWFILILFSLIFLTSSVVSITLDAVIAPLRVKRIINLISFCTFLLGFILFLISLFFLLFII